ncbi:hypothetical protein OXV71_14665 [Bacteroides fragilis]|nr:hypothetical protein [Bacteroides fragilis]
MKQTVEEAEKEYCDKNYPYSDLNIKLMVENAFEAGAEWQAKQSPWISVNQYPPMDKPLLLKYGDGGIDDMDLGFYTGLHYLTKDGQEVDKHVIEYMVL